MEGYDGKIKSHFGRPLKELKIMTGHLKDVGGGETVTFGVLRQAFRHGNVAQKIEFVKSLFRATGYKLPTRVLSSNERVP